MEFNISKNSFNSKLYRSTYGKNSLPMSLCPYFHKSILAWIIMLLSWPGHIENIVKKRYDVKAWQWAFHFPIAVGLPLMIATKVYTDSIVLSHDFMKLYIIGLVSIIIFIGIIIGITFLVIKIGDLFNKIKFTRENFKIVERRPSLIKGYWTAFKDKVCPKIKWID